MSALDNLAQPTSYQIRLKGKLDSIWADWFAGFSITYINSDNFLEGAVADQAALHGILAKVRDLGLPIRSIITSKTVLRF